MCSRVLSSRYSAAIASRRSVSSAAASPSRRRAIGEVGRHGLELGRRRAQLAPVDERAQPPRGGGVEPPARPGQLLQLDHLGAVVEAERVEPVAQRRGVGADRHDGDRRVVRDERGDLAGIGPAGRRQGAGRAPPRRAAPPIVAASSPAKRSLIPATASILGGMMADTSDDPRLGTVIAGYRIEERIGRGGMGVVYRAQHLNLQRRAAIKIIAPDLAESEGFRERFTREARIAAALQHPNIVTVYDAGEVDGMLYLAMQFIQGEDLAAILRRDGRLRPYRAIDVCRQVASALDAAHAMGLIHRDVKPANVLIEGRNAFLTDFGLTKQAEGTHAQLTRAGDMVGTIHYVAPEQIEGRARQRALGRLRARLPALPLPLGPGAVRARDRRRRHLRAPVRAAAEAVRAAARAARGARRGHGQGARQVAGPALPELRRHDLRRPRGDRRRRPAERDDPAAGEPGRRAGADAEIRDAAEAARRPRVLLGGLDDRTRAVARVALGDRVDVLEAPAQATADRAREERPDLVILDWAGAGRAGIEALRNDALTRDAKVLLLTDGEGKPRRRRRGRRRAARGAVLAAPAPGQAAPPAGRRGHRRVIAAVLAGGRGRRMGALEAARASSAARR